MIIFSETVGYSETQLSFIGTLTQAWFRFNNNWAYSCPTFEENGIYMLGVIFHSVNFCRSK